MSPFSYYIYTFVLISFIQFDSKKEEAKEVKETGEAKTKFTVPAAGAESPEQAAPEEAPSAPEGKATKQQPVPDKDNE